MSRHYKKISAECLAELKRRLLEEVYQAEDELKSRHALLLALRTEHDSREETVGILRNALEALQTFGTSK